MNPDLVEALNWDRTDGRHKCNLPRDHEFLDLAKPTLIWSAGSNQDIGTFETLPVWKFKPGERVGMDLPKYGMVVYAIEEVQSKGEDGTQVLTLRQLTRWERWVDKLVRRYVRPVQEQVGRHRV